MEVRGGYSSNWKSGKERMKGGGGPRRSSYNIGVRDVFGKSLRPDSWKKAENPAAQSYVLRRTRGTDLCQEGS